MNQKVKQQWIQALRSGEYQQGDRGLCRIGIDENGKEVKTYCCLGVLSDLYINAHPNEAEWATVDNLSKGLGMQDMLEFKLKGVEGGTCLFLHANVAQWIGLDVGSPTIIDKNRETRHLTALNDIDMLSFNEIADMIELNR